MMDYFIDDFACSLEGIDFDETFQQFKDRVMKIKWSSPGPDGMHYCFWTMDERGATLIWDARNAMRRGQKPPPTFNYSLLIVIEKKLRQI